jgi:NAD(P)-dependent dehydrogenase (short-subunit alcohol dehydrogenase family)
MKKLVFVTGAGRGIGQAIALKLADEGFSVSGCSRTLSQLEDTKEKSQNKIRVASINVADGDAVKKWMGTELKETGATPWGLVSAAGVYGPIGSFIENSWDDWKAAMEINMYGTALACKYFAQILIEKKIPGSIVLLSGGGATQPLPRFSSYGACKSAVVRFGETLAYELKPHHITVNSIAPGAVNTKLTDDLIKAGPDKVGKEMYEKALKQKESGGTTPDKAAALAAYLLSEKANTITGRLLSAVWDPWPTLHDRSDELEKSDIYTLRRIVPEDRKKDWSK